MKSHKNSVICLRW